MHRMIVYYIQGNMDKKEIKAAYESAGPDALSFRTKAAYQMIRFCPWMLKVLYPVFHSFKTLKAEVFQR